MPLRSAPFKADFNRASTLRNGWVSDNRIPCYGPKPKAVKMHLKLEMLVQAASFVRLKKIGAEAEQQPRGRL